jgi:hypothetical protein
MAAEYECPELVALYHTYTSGPDTIASRFGEAHHDSVEDGALVVATGRDIALYPGNGRDPEVQSFRLAARGFKEITGISHLGPAVASLVRLRELGGDWRTAANGLLDAVESARIANNAALWREIVRVPAYRGIEAQIAAMVDYACVATGRYLRRVLSSDTYLNARTLVHDYMQTSSPASISAVMVATFFLVGMETSHRVLNWFDRRDIDWSRAMVMVAGQQGRPTAGLTWNTSSVATMIVGASRKRLPVDRVYLAPHAPVFDTPVGGDLSQLSDLEDVFRRLWLDIRATTGLGELMFPGYPRFQAAPVVQPDLSAGRPQAIAEMPMIHSATDMTALISRLRIVLEDPRQLLSGAVMDFAVDQLLANDNDPTRLTVPGLTGVDYSVVRGDS